MNKGRPLNNISVGFYRGTPDKASYKYTFMGCWYKPWTWLRWQKVYTIKGLTLFDVSVVEQENNTQKSPNG